MSNPPATAVILRANSLFGSRGCGERANQVYKYAVTIVGLDPLDPGGSAMLDCFADAYFLNLPTDSDSGTLKVAIEVRAFNQAGFALQTEGVDPRSFDAPVNVAALRPTWSTVCDATQRVNVQVPAVCGPLRVGGTAFGGAVDDASIEVRLGEFASAGDVPSDAGVPADAGSDASADADAGADGSLDPDADVEGGLAPRDGGDPAGDGGDAEALDASDAAPQGDGAATDAGADQLRCGIDFDRVSVRALTPPLPGQVGGVLEDTREVPCAGGALYRLAPAAAPATYDLTLHLSNATSGSEPGWQVRCSFATSPGLVTRGPNAAGGEFARCGPAERL